MKSAPLSFALRAEGIDEVVVHTGQHYDHELSTVFFEELGIPEPRVPARPPHRRPGGDGGADPADPRAGAPGPRPRVRRHELDARGRPRGDDCGHPARARRGGPAKRGSHDARGAHADRGGRARRVPLQPGRAFGGDAAARGRAGRDPRRRRRDGRREPALRAHGPRALSDRVRAGQLRRGDDPSPGERVPAAPRARRRGAEPNRRARRVPRSSAHALEHGGRRALARPAHPPARARSDIWSSHLSRRRRASS